MIAAAVAPSRDEIEARQAVLDADAAPDLPVAERSFGSYEVVRVYTCVRGPSCGPWISGSRPRNMIHSRYVVYTRKGH